MRQLKLTSILAAVAAALVLAGCGSDSPYATMGADPAAGDGGGSSAAALSATGSDLVAGAMDFPAAKVGTMTGKTVVLVNGGSLPVTISARYISGPGASIYDVNGCDVTTSITPGASCTASVTAAPTSTSDATTAKLSITVDGNKTTEVDLSATVIPPDARKIIVAYNDFNNPSVTFKRYDADGSNEITLATHNGFYGVGLRSSLGTDELYGAFNGLQVYDIATGAMKHNFAMPVTMIFQPRADGKLFNISYDGNANKNQVHIVNPADGSLVFAGQFDFASGGWVTDSLVVSDATNRAYAMEAQGALTSFDLTTGALLGTIPSGIPNVGSAHLAPNGKLLVVAGYATGFSVWTLDPVTGAASVLLNQTTPSNGYFSTSSLADIDANKLYVYEANASYVIDMTTGALLSTGPASVVNFHATALGLR